MQNLTHQAFKLGIWYAKGGNPVEVPEEVCPENDLAIADEQLAACGYIVDQESLAGRSVAVEERCKALATGRNIRKYRRDEIALRVLDWVDEHPDHPTAIHELAEALGEDFTGKFERDEFMSIGRRLAADEYLTGIKADGGVVIRPQLTAKGERCLHSGYGLSGFENIGGAQVNNYEANISGNVGGLQQGDRNTMQVTQNNEIDRVLSEMWELVPEDSGDAAEHMEAIEVQAKSGSKLAAPIRALVTALGASLGTEAGQKIGALGEQLTNLLQQS